MSLARLGGGWCLSMHKTLLQTQTTASLSSLISTTVDASLFRDRQQQYRQQPLRINYQTVRCYTPMTPEEEKTEQDRVAVLSELHKERELRQLNRQIALLEMKKGINTGDLYTWSGRYRMLARDYGFPLFVWYWAVWGGTFMATYVVMEYGGVDSMAFLAKLDQWTGYDISSQVRPEYGKLGMALVVNEILEFGRLPFVVATVKPVFDKLFPTKY